MLYIAIGFVVFITLYFVIESYLRVAKQLDEERSPVIKYRNICTFKGVAHDRPGEN